MVTVFFLFLAVCCFIGCAPKVITSQPPRYENELSPEEIVTRVSDDIQRLKAVAEIKLEKNGELIEQVNASVLLQRPGRVHMRVYKFGMLTGDIIARDGELHGLAGGGNTKLAGLVGEIFHAVFWWDDLQEALMYTSEDAYIITTLNREIHLDRVTLLPVMQDISAQGKNVHITYSGPRNYEGWWYPSNLTISSDVFRFSVKIEKLLRDPAPGESDFQVPAK